MGITLRGVNLGYMSLDLSPLSNRPDNVGLAYRCPAIAYVIETPEGRILWETGLSADAGIVHLPGHTPGHDNYAEPVAAPQIFWDVDRWRRSLDVLKGIAKEHEAWLFPGHEETGIQHLDGREELVPIEFAAGHTYA